MNIPLPFINQPAGLGDAVKSATQSVGVKPCGGCHKRAEALNRALTFVPLNADPKRLPTARIGVAYEAMLPGVVVGGAIPPGLRADPVAKKLSGVPTAKGKFQMIVGSEKFTVEVKA